VGRESKMRGGIAAKVITNGVPYTKLI